MIDVGRASTTALRDALAASGGFAWWYADLLGPSDDGLVLIWSFGLPLLPGREPPRERPGLCVALYRRGRPMLYSLQEYAADDGQLCIGESGASFRFGRTLIELGPHQLRAHIDAAIPGSHGRLVGSLSVSGAACETPPSDAGHAWSPLLGGAVGHARLSVDGEEHEVSGRAYVDQNVSATPLSRLGIARWRWGRVALPSREIVYYLVEGARESRSLCLSIQPNGTARTCSAVTTPRSTRSARWGIEYAEDLLLETAAESWRIRCLRLLEDGPFYLRFLIEAQSAEGERGRGFAEALEVGRVDVPWQRPLVRMRRHRLYETNSLWLPLFNGARRDRHRRLLRSWWWRLRARDEVRA